MLEPWALVACLAQGCGSGTIDDCRDPAQACFAPFQCEPSSADPDARACSTQSAGLPECRGVPAGSGLDVTLTEDDMPVHHLLLSDCLPVTYSPTLESRRAAIVAAVAAWRSVTCNGLCVTGPALATEAPNALRGERRIHFEIGEAGGASLLPTLFYELATGRAIACTVELAAAEADAFATGDALAALMLCSGFAPATADSVTAPGPAGSRPETLTATDESALCALYGMPPYCAGEDARF